MYYGRISLAHLTMYAELCNLVGQAQFDEQFPLEGSFNKNTVKGRDYWYFMTSTKGGVPRKRMYVGPDSDPEIRKRVAEHRREKSRAKERRDMVRSLLNGGFTGPTSKAGDVLKAMADAGFFRMRGVLIGTLAFQTYSGILGFKLPNTSVMTLDVDLAKFHSISAAIGVDDKMPVMLDTLRAVDETYKPIYTINSTKSTKFSNADHLEVEFLTPNRGSDNNQGHPSDMPTLGGASAEPLRYLDYLIKNPVRATVLYQAGIEVSVPAPERFAIHKLIVSCLRRKDDMTMILKSKKDIAQSEILINGLDADGRSADIGYAWIEAWDRGKSWRSNIKESLLRLPPDVKKKIAKGILVACKEDSIDPSFYLTALEPETPDETLSLRF